MWWWLLQHLVTTAFLIACVAIVCRLVPAKPALHHALWLVVLIKFLLPPGVAWPWSVSDMIQSFATVSGVEPLALIVDGQQSNDLINVRSVTDQVGQATSVPMLETLFLLVWLSGAAIVGARHLRRLLNLRSIIRHAPPAPQFLTAAIHTLAQQMGTRPIPAVVVSGIDSPFVWCLGRLILVWPDHLATKTQCADLSGVIAHELAHVKRRDHWIAWLEFVAGIVWWWNPLCWATKQRLHASAEVACDAIAIDNGPYTRRAYAEALLKLSSLRSPQPAFTLGANLRERRTFEGRLKMIMSNRTTGSMSRRALLAVGLAAIVVTPNWLWNHAASSSTFAAEAPASRPTEAANKNDHVVAFHIAELGPAAGLKEAKFKGRDKGVVYLHTTPILTGDDIAEATVRSSSKESEIEVVFSKSGAAKISKATDENPGKRLAFVVNGQVVSAPTIRSKVDDRAKITGKFTRADLLDLIATVLPSAGD